MNENEWIDRTSVVPTVYKAVERKEVDATCDDCSGCHFYFAWREGLCSPEIALEEGRPCWHPDRTDGVNIWWEEVV